MQSDIVRSDVKCQMVCMHARLLNSLDPLQKVKGRWCQTSYSIRASGFSGMDWNGMVIR